MIVNKIIMDGVLLTIPMNINKFEVESIVDKDLLYRLFMNFGLVANIRKFEDILPISLDGTKLTFNVVIELIPRNNQDVTLTKVDSFLHLNGFSFTGNLIIETY